MKKNHNTISNHDLLRAINSGFTNVEERLEGVENRLGQVGFKLDKVETRLTHIEIKVDDIHDKVTDHERDILNLQVKTKALAKIQKAR